MLSILISSTFNDMQGERDVIRTRVTPALQKVAAQYGQSVRLLDLRWGVNTAEMGEEEATQKVLDVCLDEIERCEGYMVCLLGNRYGWVPDYEMLKKAEKHGVKIDNPISVTELEIQYGILQRNQGERAIVFMRDEVENLPEELRAQYYDEAGDTRLSDLKEKLSKLPKISCSHYSLTYEKNEEFDGLNDFAERLLEKLTGLLERIYGAEVSLTDAQKLQKQFESIASNHMEGYMAVPELEEALAEFAASDDMYWNIQGNMGMGLSAFVSRLWNHAPEGVTIIPYFCGTGTYGNNPQELLAHFVEILGEKPLPLYAPLSEHFEHFTDLLAEVKEPTWFVVDGIEKIDVPQEQNLDWMPRKLSQNVRFVITSRIGELSCEQLADYWSVKKTVIPGIRSVTEHLRQQLAVYGKEIPTRLLDKVSNHPLSSNYFFCDMIIKMLMLMNRNDFRQVNDEGGGIEQINSYIDSKLQQLPETMEEMAFLFLYDSGEQIMPGATATFFAALSCIPSGLRAQDLQTLFPELWSELEFSYFTLYFEDYLVQDENGCYRFAKPILRYACQKVTDVDVFSRIAYYLRELPLNDPVKVSSSARIFLAMEWHEELQTLILRHSDAEIIKDQVRDMLQNEQFAFGKLLASEEVLDWFIREIIPTLKHKELMYHAARLLENCAKEGKPHIYNELAQLYIKCGQKEKAYRLLKQFVETADEKRAPLEVAKACILYTECFFAETDEEREASKLVLNQGLRLYEENGLPTSAAKCSYLHGLFYQHLYALQQEFGFELTYAVSMYDYIYHKGNKKSEYSYMDIVLLRGLRFLSAKDAQITEVMVEELFALNRLAHMVFETMLEEGAHMEELGELLLDIYRAMEKADSANEPLKGKMESGIEERLQQFRIQRENFGCEVILKFKERLRNSGHISSLRLLARMQLRMAVIVSDEVIRQRFLSEGCRVLERYFTQEPLSDFANELKSALLNLALCELEAKDTEKYEETLERWSEVAIGINRYEISEALKECRKYPDEIHRETLIRARRKQQNLWEEFAGRLWIGGYYEFQEALDNIFAVEHMLWSQGKLKGQNICTPQMLQAQLNAVSRLEREYENPELNEMKRKCLPVAIGILMYNTYKLLVVLEKKLDENSEEEILRPNHFYLVAVAFMDRYFDMMREEKVYQVNERSRLIYLYQLAHFQIKAAVYCPKDAKKLAESTLELIEFVQDSFEPMPQISASWNHDEINEKSFRRLACYAYILLEEMA